jgi:hypothetical protein
LIFNVFIVMLYVLMQWIPQVRRKRGRPRKTRMEGVQAAMTTRNLEIREEWRLVPEDGDSCYKTGRTDGQAGGQIDR